MILQKDVKLKNNNFITLFDSKLTNWSLQINFLDFSSIKEKNFTSNLDLMESPGISPPLRHHAPPPNHSMFVCGSGDRTSCYLLTTSLHIRWTWPARSANLLRGNMRHMRTLALFFCFVNMTIWRKVIVESFVLISSVGDFVCSEILDFEDSFKF